jgi:uncharacterized membrane protein
MTATAERRTVLGTDRAVTSVVIGATVVCALLMLHQLGQDSFWTDETFSIGTVDRPFGDMLWRLTNWEVNQSPYLLLLYGWLHLGRSEGFLLLLSVAFSVASVPMVFVAGRRLFDARVGAVAALLLAVHPLFVEHGRQLRSYSMLVFMTTAMVVALCRLIERPTTARAIAFAAVAAVASYTHFYALLSLAGLAVSLVALPREARRVLLRPLGIATAVLAVALTPLAVYFLDREGDPLAWLAGQRKSMVIDTGRRLLGAGLPAAAAFAVALSVAVWASVQLWRRGAPTAARSSVGTSEAGPFRPGDEVDPSSLLRWRVVVTWSWLVVPCVIAAGVTVTIKPMLESKYLIGVVPAVAILAGLAVTSIPNRWWAGALLAVLVATSLRSDVALYEGEHEQWRTAAEVLAAGPPAEVLPVPWREGTHALDYYLDRVGGDPGVLLASGASPSGGREVWVVRRPASAPRPEDRRVLAEVEERFRPVEEVELNGLVLTRYVPDT